MSAAEPNRDTPPALDCISRGHVLVEDSAAGAFPTANGEIAWASWCLWCGTGVSNEAIPDYPKDQP